MKANRPKLSSAKKSFREVYDDIGKSASDVGAKTGGKVDYNINTVPVGQGHLKTHALSGLAMFLMEMEIRYHI